MPDQSETYELHIDVFTPDSIPMSRLAGYMAQFAELLGNREHVRFARLGGGSLTMAAQVNEVAIRKVDRRIDEIRYGTAPISAQRAFQTIDYMLAEDRANGQLRRGRAKLIEFPGRSRHVEEKIGPVQQTGFIDGEVIQIGGRDETINVHIRTAGQFVTCVTNREAARKLAAYLFGGPVRIYGNGTWARLESGAWELKKFIIASFSPLDETPLSKVFEGLRSRLKPPAAGRENPVRLVEELRAQD